MLGIEDDIYRDNIMLIEQLGSKVPFDGTCI